MKQLVVVAALLTMIAAACTSTGTSVGVHAQQISVGEASGAGTTCAVMSDSTVRCWGILFDPDGVNGFATSSTSRPVQGLGDVVDVASGQIGACAVKSDGSLWCWGTRLMGLLGGVEWGSEPVRVDGVYDATAVTQGRAHGCILLASSAVKCFGDNQYGQLGQPGPLTAVPLDVPGLEGVTSLDAGADGTCAVTVSEELWCWGQGSAFMEDAGGDVRPVGGSAPIMVLPGVTDVAHGGDRVCAVRTDRSVSCRGFGALGNGSSAGSANWVTTPAFGEVQALTSSNESTCATTGEKEVWCWGIPWTDMETDEWNWNSKWLVPTRIEEAAGAVQADVSQANLCVLRDQRGVYCLGARMIGGISDGFDPAAPAAVERLGPVADIGSGGEDPTTCALEVDGEVWCWGINHYGQLGNGAPDANEFRHLPSRVALADAVALGAGGEHACAVLTNGQVWCWGHNNYGQLGNGGLLDSGVPVRVAGIDSAQAVSVSNSHTCARLDDGTARCWGRNNRGQLGGSTAAFSALPVTVDGLGDIQDLDAGGSHACALTVEGTMYCWGANSAGQLGNGTRVDSALPVRVQELTLPTSLSVGGDHSCVIQVGASAACWGDDNHGEVTGTASNDDVLTPRELPGVVDVSYISAGSYSTHLVVDGQVFRWGNPHSQQENPLEPVEGLGNAASVHSGGEFGPWFAIDSQSRAIALKASTQGSGVSTYQSYLSRVLGT